MKRKVISKGFLVGVLIVALGTLSMGCGSRTWSPTDPRINEPDPANINILDRWEATIETDIQ
ncbi:hypothetical protein KAR34_05095 [bacterium]|nr:hypothetical protein [bacterium]